MVHDDGVALVRHYLASPSTLDNFDDLFAADYVNHHPEGGEDSGPEAMKEFVRAVFGLIPDLSVEVQEPLRRRGHRRRQANATRHAGSDGRADHNDRDSDVPNCRRQDC